MLVALNYYEGLVCATARRCVGFCEDDFEDVAQVLRVKVWQALRAYDPAKSRTTRDKYVFMCVRDRAKDVVKKKKRNQLHIEDLRTEDTTRAGHAHRAGLSDRFDERYLCSTHDDNYAIVDDDEDPLADLDDLEREIVGMLTADYKQTQVAKALGLPKAEMERAMKSIRSKLSALRPDAPAAAARRPAPVRRLPRRGHHGTDRLTPIAA